MSPIYFLKGQVKRQTKVNKNLKYSLSSGEFNYKMEFYVLFHQEKKHYNFCVCLYVCEMCFSL